MKNEWLEIFSPGALISLCAMMAVLGIGLRMAWLALLGAMGAVVTIWILMLYGIICYIDEDENKPTENNYDFKTLVPSYSRNIRRRAPVVIIIYLVVFVSMLYAIKNGYYPMS